MIGSMLTIYPVGISGVFGTVSGSQWHQNASGAGSISLTASSCTSAEHLSTRALVARPLLCHFLKGLLRYYQVDFGYVLKPSLLK